MKTLINLLCVSVVLSACAHLTHDSVCRGVAGKSADQCSTALMSYSHRKELLTSFAKNGQLQSKFEVIDSSIPTVNTKAVHGSSDTDIAAELSRIDLAALAKKDFLLFLDMDDTILEQWAPFFVQGYHSLTIRENDSMNWYIALTPGLENLLQTIRSLNGGIILFSRNDIRRVEALADLIPVSGKSLRQSVDGIISGSHIKGKYKDLSIIRHPNSIMLDDSPESILPAQWGQVLAIEKFKPDLVNVDQGLMPSNSPVHPSWAAGTTLDGYKINFSSERPSVQQFMQTQKSRLDHVVEEIVAAHTRSKKNRISFLKAIQPYSYAATRR